MVLPSALYHPSVIVYSRCILRNNTNIRFTLKSDANVNIAVYNVVGMRVATIANNRYPAGENTVTWNGAMLESGMYIVRMNTGNEVSTIKFLKK